MGEKIIILDPVTKPAKQPRNRLSLEPTRKSDRIGDNGPNYADPVWFNNRSFGMNHKPIVSEGEKMLNKRIKIHNVAEKEIRDFEFQLKLEHIEYIDKDERNAEDRLPDCSLGVKDNHWVGYTLDGRVELLHSDYINLARKGIEDSELLFPKDLVNHWKLNKNEKHQLSEEMKRRIKAMGDSFEKTPDFLVTRFRYNDRKKTWEGLLGTLMIVPLSDRWMHQNVKELDRNYFHDHCSVKVRSFNWVNMPVGFGSSKKEELSTLGYLLLYKEKAGCATCVIVNIMNTLYLLKDEVTHSKIKGLENNDNWIDLVNRSFTNCNFPHVTCGIQVLRDHKYLVRKVKVKSVLEYKFVHPTLCVISNTHCVVIWNKNIIDSNHTHTLKLNIKNLNWCSGESNEFSRIILAYEFKPCPKIAKKINYMEYSI